jgi:dimethylhistidine N-methyltransferase
MTRPPVRAAADAARPERPTARFADEVRTHLLRSPRQLPTRYLYDELGSALFEAICQLPWYRITRAEDRLIRAHREEIARGLADVDTVVELGSGSGLKLRQLLSAQALVSRLLSVHLVDLSRSALELASRTLDALPHARVVAHEAEYRDGLADAARSFDGPGRALVLFLGSNLGNVDPAESAAFLRTVRDALRPGDALLLGTDLVKPERELRLAYDDPLGVTAAFDRNLLLRLNRELGADFDVPCWAHRAVWNAAASRVEMHLVARGAQRVRIPAAEVEIDFADGEHIWTESSYKYTPASVDALLSGAGFAVSGRWTDAPDAFALTLAVAT